MSTTRNPERLINKAALFEDLGYRPHPGQLLVHQSRAPRRVLAAGVRWGKSLAAAMEAIAAALEPAERSRGWVVAPSYELAQKVYREIAYTCMKHLKHRIVKIREHDHMLVLRNLGGGLCEVRAKSADSEISLLGEALDWLVLDEAARVKPRIWESYLTQRLIDRRGWALMISTPKGRGWFYDAFRLGQGKDSDYESWCFPSWSNPHLDAALIEAERARLPERVFAQEFGAEFLSGSGQIFTNVRDRAVLDSWPEPVKGTAYYVGLDLARLQDYTVICVMDEDCRVVHQVRFTRIDWSIQIARVKATCDRYNGAQVLADGTGVGDPVHQALRQADIAAESYTFTARSKSALIDNLCLMMERGEITLPSARLCPELVSELEAYTFSVTEAGNVRTGAPSGENDDCVLALALAAWQTVHRRGAFELQFIELPRPRPLFDEWGWRRL